MTIALGLIVGLFTSVLPSTGARAAETRTVCDVRSFGAKGDGATKDTKAIQAAIDRCASTNGIVLLARGTFLSGTVHLRSGIELRIDSTAVLKGTRDDNDYPDLNTPSNNSQLSDCKKSLISAQSVHDVTISGGGTVDGNGNNPRWVGKEGTRPMAIFAALSKNVTIQNLKIRDAGMWAVVNLENDNVVLKDLDIRSLFHPNRDGIDLVDCHHVVVENVTVASDDDAICLKSGSAKGVLDVTVRNSRVVHSGANGLKFGSASAGFFKQIRFENIDLQDLGSAAIAIESVDGAAIDDISYKDIRLDNVAAPIFILLGRRFLSMNYGSIQNISFENIRGTARMPWGSTITGTSALFSTYKIRNVRVSGFNITNLAKPATRPATPAEYGGQYPDAYFWGEVPAYGFFLRHVDGFSIKNSSMKPAAGDPRPAFVQDDVTNFKQD